MAGGSKVLKKQFGIVAEDDAKPQLAANFEDVKTPVAGIDIPAEIDAKTDAEAEILKDIGTAELTEKVIAALDCYQDQFGVCVTRAAIGQRREVTAIDSQAGGDSIRAKYRALTGKILGKTGLDHLKSDIRHGVRCARKNIHTFQRIAKYNGVFFVDIGNDAGEAIRIDKGSWQIFGDRDCAFKRPRGYRSLASPQQSGSGAAAFKTLSGWLRRHGVPEDRIPLVVALLVCWLMEGASYPILSLYGPAGCGKSTLLLLVLMLIDPPGTNTLPSIGLKTEHIAAGAQARHVLTFDNLSKLSGEVQNTLCQCSTGGIITTRALYTNGDVAELPIHRPVGMTSVTPVITQPDLMSRSVPVELPVRNDRRNLNEILDEFHAEAGGLLGALLELTAISTVPTSEEETVNHRLYEFCFAGQRVCAAGGLEPSHFVDLVDRMRASTGADIAAGDPFVTAVRDILNKKAETAITGDKLPGYRTWWQDGWASVSVIDGTVICAFRSKALLERFTDTWGASSGWRPKNTRQLDHALLRATPIFNDIRINVTKLSAGDGRPYWEFSWKHKDG
tara:strand:- start:998 stop:2680 length:1683 start_codon:yes stop_codon:yes gene_type:complete